MRISEDEAIVLIIILMTLVIIMGTVGYFDGLEACVQ